MHDKRFGLFQRGVVGDGLHHKQVLDRAAQLGVEGLGIAQLVVGLFQKRRPLLVVHRQILGFQRGHRIDRG